MTKLAPSVLPVKRARHRDLERDLADLADSAHHAWLALRHGASGEAACLMREIRDGLRVIGAGQGASR